MKMGFKKSFIKSMPKLSRNEVRAFLVDLSTPENMTEEEKNLIQNVRKLRKSVGSPIKL